jgi:hypothetical protein
VGSCSQAKQVKNTGTYKAKGRQAAAGKRQRHTCLP